MRTTIDSPAIESAELPSGRRVYVADVPVQENPTDIEVWEPQHEVWLAPKGASTVPGKGTQFNPLRVGTPQEYDAVFTRPLEAIRTSPKVFRLYPGDYYTRGVWAFEAQNYHAIGSGESLIGSGSRRTTVHLDADSAPFTTNGQPRPDIGVLWVGTYMGRAEYMRVEGLCLHGHQDKFPAEKLVTSGVRVTGSHFVIRDVGVQGLRGSVPAQYEAFPISSINFEGLPLTNPADGGGLIEDCWTRSMADNSYVSAISLGFRPCGRPIVPSVIQRCHVDSGRGNYFGFSACHSTTIRDSSCRGVKQAVYNDTDSVQDLLVYDNQFETEYAGMSLIAVEASAGKSVVKVQRNRFTFVPTGAYDLPAIALVDQAGARISNILVSENVFVAPPSNRFALASIKAAQLFNVKIVNNVISSGTVYRNLVDPTPKTNVTLASNHEYNGGLVGIYQPLAIGS
jgi:hypothetical protein